MFRFRRASALTAVLTTSLLVSLAACGDDSTSDSTLPAATAPAATEPAATAAPATDASVATTDEPAAGVPSKIISLSPTATEILFAIGAGDQVIAVDDQSNYPADAEAKMTDLSGFTPNLESIAAYEPDLVVHDGTTDLASQLDGLGIANWIGSAATGFDDIYTQIEQLGAATGHVGEAAELVGQMQSDIEAAVAAGPGADAALTFYHELDPTFFSVTSNTFIGQVYALFGLVNIADTAEGGSDYPQLSAEFIISQNPDLVFLADTKCCGESVETVSARPGWDVVTAVVNGSVIVIDDDIASRWGPRVVELVEIISAAASAASVAA